MELATRDAPCDGGALFYGLNNINLLRVAYGAILINQGALLEGLRAWNKVAVWGTEEIDVARQSVRTDRLLNAVAEQRFGFDGEDASLMPSLVAGALLGKRVAEVVDYYDRAHTFFTRSLASGTREGWIAWTKSP